MGFGEVWWFWKGSEPGAVKLAIDALIEMGLSAENALGERFYLNDSGRVPWDERRFVDLWDAGDVVTVQLWASTDEDVWVSADRNSSLITLDLDGLGLMAARIVVDVTVRAAVALPGTRTLIVDRRLPDGGDEWMQRVELEADGPLHGADLRLTYSADDDRFVLAASPSSWVSRE